MQLTSIRNFLDYVEKAMEYGLEIESNEDETPKIVMPKDRVSSEIGIWAKRYAITSWNGGNQGYVMMNVYTESGANLLKFIFDSYTTDTKEGRKVYRSI